MLVRLVPILLLLSVCVVDVSARLRIAGSLSSDRVSVDGIFTNRVMVTCIPDGVETLLTNDVRFRHIADPVYTGLKTVSTSFSEQFVHEGGRLIERRLYLSYVFSPKYAGTMVLKARPVHIVFGRRTNTVMTPVQTVTVYEPGNNALIVLLLGLPAIAGGLFWIFRMKKRSAEVAPDDIANNTESDGGRHVE